MMEFQYCALHLVKTDPISPARLSCGCRMDSTLYHSLSALDSAVYLSLRSFLAIVTFFWLEVVPYSPHSNFYSHLYQQATLRNFPYRELDCPCVWKNSLFAKSPFRVASMRALFVSANVDFVEYRLESLKESSYAILVRSKMHTLDDVTYICRMVRRN
jgi:hypothetical protein